MNVPINRRDRDGQAKRVHSMVDMLTLFYRFSQQLVFFVEIFFIQNDTCTSI